MSEEKDFCFLYGLGNEDYHDIDGNRISLHKLSRLEPEWAAARIREGRKLREENERLREIVDEVENLHIGTDLFSEAASGICDKLIELIEKELGDE